MAHVAPTNDEPLNDSPSEPRLQVNYFKEFTAGLTVSFAAMSLGVAFGDSSGRGALNGVISAGVIALITSLIGGTKVQCSGPTAPMTAVTVLITAYALKSRDQGGGPSDEFAKDFPGDDPELFVNSTMLMAGLMLILMGVGQVGRLITLVPEVVISGFMNGIAIMVWVPQIQKLFGWGEKKMTGAWYLNLGCALITLFLIMNLPKVIPPKAKPFLPATLLALVSMSLLVFIMAQAGIDIQLLKTEPINSFGEVGDMFTENFPSQWSMKAIIKGLPFAFQLAMLGYIDTLLTTVIVDKKVKERYKDQAWRPTNKTVELVSQGIANGACAFFGGIPGAQATIRSVLILNEGAMTQVAGCCAGLLTVFEMAALQSLVSKIPQSVLTGVLFKVGYDCFDWTPVYIYIDTQILRKEHPGASDPNRASEPMVPHSNMIFIVLTCIANSFFPLYIVVFAAVALFYLINLVCKIPDLVPYNEQTERCEPVSLDTRP